MGTVARVVGWGLLGLLVILLGFLLEAHWEIRRLPPRLPERTALAEATAGEGGPVRVSWLNTATQRSPGTPPVGHPVFLLEWADGRMFALDTGMDREGAEAFGRVMERLIDAEPIAFHGSVAEQLGPAVSRLRGVAFTHLHNDHTGGLASLCDAMDDPLPVFQTPRQAELGNYTTRPGRAHLAEAGCAHREGLSDGPLFAVPGFPGLFAIEGGGHTPGSTIFVARGGATTWVFAGDVTNFREPLLANEPKPRLYSLLVTPEASGHLETLRTWLAGLDAEPDVRVVVSHDVEAIAETGPPRRAR